MNEATIFGTISKAGKLSANITPEYRALITSNPGSRVLITMSVCGGTGTILQEVYYKKAVLPCLQKGYKTTGDDMTLQETHERVQDLCPGTADRDPELSLTKQQMSDLIEWSIRYCAENFAIIVPNPNEDTE